MRPRILIVSPALARANNGNWQTARRWAAFLREAGDVRVCLDWDGAPADLMIALHARRSAGAIARFAAAGGPVAVVLTGTDLYRDIRLDTDASRSLELADRLVVLQEQGIEELPAALRAKAEAQGSGDFSSMWAGQNASGCRAVPAAELARGLAEGFTLTG